MASLDTPEIPSSGFRDTIQDSLRHKAEVGCDAHCQHCKEYRNRVRKIVDELEQGNMATEEARDKYYIVRGEISCTTDILSLLLDLRWFRRRLIKTSKQKIKTLREGSRINHDSALWKIKVLEEITAKPYRRAEDFVCDEVSSEMEEIDAHDRKCSDLEKDIEEFIKKQSILTKGSNTDQTIKAMLEKEHDELLKAIFSTMSYKLPERPLDFQLGYHGNILQVTRISSRGRKTFPTLEEETVVKRPWAPSLMPMLAY